MTPPAETIAERVAAVRARVRAACERASRDPAGVTLIAVSKTFGPGDVIEALAAGVTDIGENYVQEALPKLEALRAAGHAPALHFIGHLQRNKARQLVGARVDLIHTVDSLALAEAIARAADAAQPVLIEVNVAGEQTKQGVDPAAVPAFVTALRRLEALDVRGLMAIPPPSPDPETTRPFARLLRDLAAETGLRYLSVGMTGDFEVAVEEGATHIRVGRAIFGERKR